MDPFDDTSAEDETDGGSSGPGSSPNVMMWDDVAAWTEG